MDESFLEKLTRLGLADHLIGDLIDVIDEQRDEIDRMKSLLDGAMEVVELFDGNNAQRNWREAWLKDVREILKEDSDE